MQKILLSLLGPFHLERAGDGPGGTSVGLRTRKERALLAYLAMQTGHWMARDVLAEMFWPGRASKTGRNNLRQAVLHIRETLGGDSHSILETNRTAIRIQHDKGLWLDTDAYNQHLALSQQHQHESLSRCPACATHLQTAAALYRGEFLKGITIAESAEFQTWVIIQREHFFHRQYETLSALVDISEKAGDLFSGLQVAHKLVELAPLEERGHQVLMRFLAARGQRAAALAQYETCKQLLAAELNVTPAPETIALHKEIYTSFTKTVSTPRISEQPSHLPLQLTPFFGRTTETAQIIQHLDNPDCRLLTLTGPGGVGKTRLALQAVGGRRQYFSDGVWFVPLADLPNQAGANILAAQITRTLGVSSEQGNPKTALLDYLGPRQSLLLLDNFEHLLDSAGFLLEILQQASEVKLLITSRSRLGFQAEFLLEVAGLPFPTAIDPENSGSPPFYPAVELFLERAGRVRSGFQQTAENRQAITQICQSLAGVPLALELAATSVQECSAAEIARQIDQNLDSLSAALRDLPPRQRSLHAVFESSWTLLEPAEQIAYRKLSVLQGQFTYEAAHAVASISLTMLADLEAKSLLHRVNIERFEFHPLLRHFAVEKLALHLGETRATRDHHSQYYLDILQRYEAQLRSSEARIAAETLYSEIANIREAWNWAVSEGQMAVLETSKSSLTRLYMVLGFLQEGATVFGQAAASLSDRLPELKAALLAEQARFLFHLAQYPATIETAEGAIQCGADPEAPSQALARYFRGEALRCQGEFAEAQPELEEVLRLSRLEDPQIQVMQQLELDCLGALAGVCVFQGKYDQAKIYLDQTLTLVKDSGDQRGQSRVLGHLGVVALEQGDYAAARARLTHSLQLREILGDRIGESMTLGNLGNLYLTLGAYAEAKPYYEKALAIQQEIGARQSECLTVGNLGILHIYLEDYETGKTYSKLALEIAQEIGDRRAQGAMWMKLGHALTGLQTTEDAMEAYQESIRVRQTLGQKQPMSEPLAGLARLHLANGDQKMALAAVEEILEITADTPDLGGTIDSLGIYYTCYQVLVAVGDDRAPEVLREASIELHRRAARIQDDDLRRSYLENVASHRAITAAAKP